MYDGLCAMFAWWMYSVCPVVCPVVGITDLLPPSSTLHHLLACLLVRRDWDPLPPPPLSQAAPDLHTARARAQHGSSSTLEVGIAPQPGEVGRSRCAWDHHGFPSLLGGGSLSRIQVYFACILLYSVVFLKIHLIFAYSNVFDLTLRIVKYSVCIVCVFVCITCVLCVYSCVFRGVEQCTQIQVQYK